MTATSIVVRPFDDPIHLLDDEAYIADPVPAPQLPKRRVGSRYHEAFDILADSDRNAIRDRVHAAQLRTTASILDRLWPEAAA